MGMAHGLGRRMHGTCHRGRSGELFLQTQEAAGKSGLWRSLGISEVRGFSMLITEIFKSIQGEGTRAGLPCIFVRLTGCNLRCTWCDTAYAFHGGTKYSIEEILEKVNALAGDGHQRVPLVEITGGEPLLQPETPALAQELMSVGYTVMIETSGERFVGKLPTGVIKIVDVKCPDSGEPDTFDLANLAAVGANDEIKFVISTRRDYDFARDFVTRHQLAERVHEVLFSPVFTDPNGAWPGLTARELAEWILGDGLRVRLGLQLHKLIWDPAMKGV
jgi:7-carboxy-7-deazaguanine synthase